MFLGAVARQNFVAPTRPNKLFWLNQVQKNISAQDYVQKKNYCWSVLCLFWWHQRTNEDFHWYRQTSFGEISTFCHKKDLWTQNNNFQTCCKIRLGYFCRQMKVKKKKFEFKQMQLKATLLFKQCRPKLNKRCFRRVGAAKFFRANAPQTRLFVSSCLGKKSSMFFFSRLSARWVTWLNQVQKAWSRQPIIWKKSKHFLFKHSIYCEPKKAK